MIITRHFCLENKDWRRCWTLRLCNIKQTTTFIFCMYHTIFANMLRGATSTVACNTLNQYYSSLSRILLIIFLVTRNQDYLMNGWWLQTYLLYVFPYLISKILLLCGCVSSPKIIKIAAGLWKYFTQMFMKLGEIDLTSHIQYQFTMFLANYNYIPYFSFRKW